MRPVPRARVSERLARGFPGPDVSGPCRRRMGAKTPQRWPRRKMAVRHGDIIVANLLFLEEHITAILPDLQARRDALRCDGRHDRRSRRSSS